MFKNFNKYDVLPDGRIWSKVSNKFLKPHTRPNGYQYVSLSDNNGKIHQESLHKVVYFAVNGLWEYPEGYEINHLSEDKTMNEISNLELVSRKHNCNYGTRNERSAKARSKRVAAYNKNDELVLEFPSTAEAGRNGYNQSGVAACCRGEIKTHKGLIWRYLDEQ